MTTPKELAGNLVTLDKRDLFDAVRAAIREAAHVDADILEVIGRKSDEAAEWSDAHDRATRCLAPLIEPGIAAEVSDAQRLDFIAKNARCDPKMDGQHVWWPTTFKNALRGATLRQAIDAAMQKDTQ